MSKLEVSARMTIRKGKLEGFKQQAAECIRQTNVRDFINHNRHLTAST